MKRRDGYTLFEVVMTTAIAGLLMSTTGQLAVRGWSAAQRAVRQADDYRVIGMLSTTWPRLLRDSRPEEWTLEGGRFCAGEQRFYVEDTHLVLDRGVSHRSVFLPRGMHCEFDIERHSAGADCAVLIIRREEALYRRHRPDAVRIVACGRGRRPA